MKLKAPPWWMIVLVCGCAYNFATGHWILGWIFGIITAFLYWKKI